MSKGMTCRIVNYYRGGRASCPISAGGGDGRPMRKRIVEDVVVFRSSCGCVVAEDG